MPWAYRHASKDFAAFLEDAKDKLGLISDNAAYTAVDGVFRAFRRRLSYAEGVAFAQVLPAVLRAIFVQDWHPEVPPPPFAPREEMAREAMALRPHHNLTPPHAIEAVAWALRRAVDQAALDRVLTNLPEGAVAFWHVDVADPGELERRIV
jgi:uncharacterized protein (DUF2267 family)